MRYTDYVHKYFNEFKNCHIYPWQISLLEIHSKLELKNLSLLSWLKNNLSGGSQQTKPSDPYISPKRINQVPSNQVIRVSISSPDKRVLTPLEEGLLPGDIILLSWSNNKDEYAVPPAYFEYEYGINASKNRMSLLDKGYLRPASPIESLDTLLVPQLKDILLSNNQKVSGKKHELISRIQSNVAPETYANLITDTNLICTSAGENLLEKYAYLVWAHKNNSKDGIINVANALTYSKSELMMALNEEHTPKAPMTQDDYFYYQSESLSRLWQQKDLAEVEKLGVKAVNEGNWYPRIFSILAMLYRKQNKLDSEKKILELGIQRNKKNPGAAQREFQKRLTRVNELIANLK